MKHLFRREDIHSRQVQSSGHVCLCMSSRVTGITGAVISRGVDHFYGRGELPGSLERCGCSLSSAILICCSACGICIA